MNYAKVLLDLYSDYYYRTFTEAGIMEERISELPLSSFPTIDQDILMEHFDELVTVPGLK